MILLAIPFFRIIGKYISYNAKKALRVDRTAAEMRLSLCNPPQAENPAEQASSLT